MKYLLAILILLGSAVIFAQSAPGNDEFGGAVSLTVNPAYDCLESNTFSGTTAGATQSATPTCSSQRIEDDVWYKFVATQASHVLSISDVKNVESGNAYHNVQVFRTVGGAPGENILCVAMSMSQKFLTGLTIGETYLVRISSWATGVRINFKLCVLTPPIPPANDEYSGAVSLQVSPDYSCSTSISGTTSGATQSIIATCSGQGVEDDVWYKFVATSASHVISVSDLSTVFGVNTYRNIQVFRNSENAPGENILCAAMTMTQKFLTGLTPGDTYWIRISSWSESTRINFTLCILTPPAPPSNDEYSGAVSLTVNPDYVCTETVSATTNGATQSSTGTCSSQRIEDDVWFYFVATRGSHIVKLDNISSVYGVNTYRNLQVFESSENAPGENIFCGTMTHTQALLNDLTVGSGYFVRVSSWSENVRISFDICVLSPVDPPVNDEYTSALSLVVNSSLACDEVVSATTDGATTSVQAACTSNNNDDVWFKFTATQTTHRVSLSNISTAYGNGNYRRVEVYTSEEGIPADGIFCSGIDFTDVVLPGLTPGSNYYVRVYTWQALTRINFDICVSTPSVPANDLCENAVDLSDGVLVSATTDGATRSLNEGSDCSNGNGYDVWYKMTPNSGGELTLAAYSNQFDIAIGAYTGTCGQLTPIECRNDGASGSENLSISANTGTTYYFQVYNNTAAAARITAETGAFTIQAGGGALPVTLASFEVSTGENLNVRLDWMTTLEVNASYFEVQHRTTEGDWLVVGRLEAAGNHKDNKIYTYIHTSPRAAVHYYRLKMVDLDGSYTFSPIRSISLFSRATVVYPNPANEFIRIDYAPGNEITSLKLLNMSGVSMPFKGDPGNGHIGTSHLPVGTYLLRIERFHSPVEVLRVVIDR